MSSRPQEARDPEGDEEPRATEKISLDDVFERLYQKIRQLASHMRLSRANPTLNATALAHEAYVKLRRNPQDLSQKSTEQVIAVFAHAMHQILIDAVRRKTAKKRAGIDAPGKAEIPLEDVLTIAAGLEQLERENMRQAQVVRCRFLLGMTAEEAAAALGTSVRTVERELQAAKQRLSELVRAREEEKE